MTSVDQEARSLLTAIAETDAAIAAAGVVGAAAYAGHQINQHGVPQRRLSLAEEKNPANASTYAVSPTPPEDEHPARISQPTYLHQFPGLRQVVNLKVVTLASSDVPTTTNA